MEKELLLIELVSNVCKDIIGLSAITSLEMPMLIKMKKNDYDNLLKSRYTGIVKREEKDLDRVDEKIKPLVSILEKETSKKNLNNVYRNIKNLSLNKNTMLYLIGWNGSYNVKNNEIKYSSNISIPHEFMHMSSAFFDEKTNTTYDGFLVSNKNGRVGVGLNEGYTELLAARKFRNGKVKAYKKEVKLASIIEKFFYKNNDMEDYYFNHDIPGFMFYMSQYASHEELKELIKDIDLMTDTNKFLSSSPNYYYLKCLNRLNNMSKSTNLSPKQKEEISSMINENKVMNLKNNLI